EARPPAARGQAAAARPSARRRAPAIFCPHKPETKHQFPAMRGTEEQNSHYIRSKDGIMRPCRSAGVAAMNCCEVTKVEMSAAKPAAETARADGLSRRSLFKGVAGLAGVAVAGRARPAQAQQVIRLAFCSQLLCVVPYEVTRAQD